MGDPAVRPPAGKEKSSPELRPHAAVSGAAPADAPLAGQSTEWLIAARDRLLADCLELEARLAETGDDAATEEALADLRDQVDHIHEELAARDLAQRERRQRAADAAPVRKAGGADTGSAAEGEDAAHILHAIEGRSRFMDELARAARQKGDLQQAAAFALDAQRLDMERVDVLCRVRSLACTRPHLDD